MNTWNWLIVVGLALNVACNFDAENPSPDATGEVGAASGGAGNEEAKTLSVDVKEGTKVFLRLSPLAVVAVGDDAAISTDWDLALSGWDVYTNSGVSGPGEGGAFGPLDSVDFALGLAGDVPFIQADETGGAFRDWYDYDASTHALYSRFHVYGIRTAERLYKLQILGYYGQLDGAPVSALYQLRYAAVTSAGAGETQVLDNVDATAGWPNVSDGAPSGCLNLASGERSALTPDDARVDADWQLCFRRDGISVNGELGGPGGVSAVDLDADQTPSETQDEIQARTPASEQARFDNVDFERLTDASVAYHGDRVVSMFGDAWVDRSADPPVPADAAWLVVSASGAQRFLLVFETLEGSTARSMGRVTLSVRRAE
jgi:hypothetical protein